MIETLFYLSVYSYAYLAMRTFYPFIFNVFFIVS